MSRLRRSLTLLVSEGRRTRAKHEALRRQMSEMGYEECVMLPEDIEVELRRHGEIWANLRVLAKGSTAAQGEASEKAAAKELARVKFIEVVQRASGGLAGEHCQQEIVQRTVERQVAQVIFPGKNHEVQERTVCRRANA